MNGKRLDDGRKLRELSVAKDCTLRMTGRVIGERRVVPDLNPLAPRVRPQGVGLAVYDPDAVAAGEEAQQERGGRHRRRWRMRSQ